MSKLPYNGGAKVTSPRGYRTLFGVTKWHPGIDLVGLLNKIILSTITGIVDGVGYGPLAGNYVRIKINSTTMAYFFHLSKYSVKKGQRINLGDVIGIEGSTGNSTGSHLHFEIRVNGVNVDPTPWLGGIIQNKVGTYKESADESAEGVQKVKIVDVYANATAAKTGKQFNVQVFSKPDVNKVIKNHLPDGRYWCNYSGITLAGVDIKGAQIIVDGKPAYVAIIDGATEYTEMTAADAYTRFLAAGNTGFSNAEKAELEAKLASMAGNLATVQAQLTAQGEKIKKAQAALA